MIEPFLSTEDKDRTAAASPFIWENTVALFNPLKPSVEVKPAEPHAKDLPEHRDSPNCRFTSCLIPSVRSQEGNRNLDFGSGVVHKPKCAQSERERTSESDHCDQP